MAFFDEWKDDSFSLTLVKLLMAVLLMLTVFLSVNSVAVDTNLYIYLVISAIIVLAIALTEQKTGIIRANFFGNKKTTYNYLFAGMVLGGLLGMLTRGGGFNLVLPTQAIFLGDLRFILANVVAPVLEPIFWRSIVFPTVLALSIAFIGKKNKAIAIIFALLIAGFSFGIYHVSAYFQTTGTFEDTYTLVGLAAMFGIIFILTNSLAQTVALEIGWHFMNNMFSEGYALDQIIPTAILFLGAGIILIEIADRISKGSK